MLRIYNWTLRSTFKTWTRCSRKKQGAVPAGPILSKIIISGTERMKPMVSQMHKEARNSAIVQSWSNQPHLERPQASSGQSTHEHCVWCRRKLKTAGSTGTGLQPAASGNSHLLWSALPILPNPSSGYNLHRQGEKWGCIENRAARNAMLQHWFANITEKLLCSRLPNLPTQQETDFVWALLRSGFQVRSYTPSTKKAQECELRQCSPKPGPCDARWFTDTEQRQC